MVCGGNVSAMGSGAGKGRGVVDATFKVICMALYATYILMGLTVAVVGVYYWSSTLIASGLVSALLLLSGVAMVGVGSAAIYGIQTDHTFLLSVVWCEATRDRWCPAQPRWSFCLRPQPSSSPWADLTVHVPVSCSLRLYRFIDIALFCMFVLFAIVGFMVGMDVRDPARTSTDNAWGVYTGTELDAQKEWRKSFWGGSYCTTSKTFGGRKQACDAVFNYHATNALLDPTSNFTEGTQIADVFADCKLADHGVPCAPSTHADDIVACAAADARSSCESIATPFSVEGCTYEEATGGDAATCLPTPSCEASLTLKLACEDCNQKVRMHTSTSLPAFSNRSHVSRCLHVF